MIQKIFLDMDGVLFNFVKSLFDIYGFNEETQHKILQYWRTKRPGIYDTEIILSDILGEVVERDEMVQQIEMVGPRFWTEMSLFPWAHELYDYSVQRVGLENVYFLSTPLTGDHSPSGKVAALLKHFPNSGRHYILTKHKELLAAPERILVDDSDILCKKWYEHNGVPVLCPQPWNEFHDLDKSPVELLRRIT